MVLILWKSTASSAPKQARTPYGEREIIIHKTEPLTIVQEHSRLHTIYTCLISMRHYTAVYRYPVSVCNVL